MLKIDTPPSTSSPTWTTLETYVRAHGQTCRQHVLGEEVEALLGRGRHERRSAEKRFRKLNAPEQGRDVYRGGRSHRRPELPAPSTGRPAQPHQGGPTSGDHPLNLIPGDCGNLGVLAQRTVDPSRLPPRL